MGPYVKIDLATIDPNGEIPDWELSYKTINPCSQTTVFTGDKEKKRLAEESPENQKIQKRKKFVPEWQVGEFLWTFLEGTKTAPEYSEENLEVETDSVDSNETLEEAAEDTPEATEAEDNLDIK